MAKIKRAILSVTDKTGLVPFAQRLAAQGVELISTGGTAKVLREAGLAVRDISDLTGFPEMLDGRVKTLHPKVHGGILYIRKNPAHVAAVKEHGIEPIDMLVVNLYAFEKTASKPGVHFEEIIENIDIGGPSMVRSAAKNFQDVAIVTSVADYEAIAAEMEAAGGELSLKTKWQLAQKAFATTSAYDTAIANALAEITCDGEKFDIDALGKSEKFPETLRLQFQKTMDLRYGENPHQAAALYSDGSGKGVANGKQLHGKELSYNNIVDLQAAWDLAQEFDGPVCAIIKHTNPCGTATGATLREAYLRALECDPVSAFGGVIGVNRQVDGAAAEEMAKLFVEAIAAPGFTTDALEMLTKKKNVRLVEISDVKTKWVLKNVSGGVLMQDNDLRQLTEADLKVVSERQPTAEELRALLFAWKVCKHVKSNAILYARDGQSVGVGAGQMSRVDSARLGAEKAVLPVAGTVAASDAFFPFPDGVEVIAKAGATAIIQPGGSVRDQEVIDAANRLGLAMVFTGVRHFRH
ncbi:MAG: bifunctional phosphoribosylaminoimidazolecarboxamide formyltransferase/IMP cyclohydrolase [Acidobacteriota bacterium]|nr:bifunctional phosphoribosylaminoimidazolecarboxamide formyltransferase/IMP cyclohydrolase [Acidobacteriota bacterium]